MPKTKKIEAIKDVVGKVLDSLGSPRQPSIKEQINKFWPKVIGKRIAQHTGLVSFKENTLVVSVEGPSWLYGLSIQKEKLIKELNKELGNECISDIRFRVGEIK